ncbi:hypothetical protein [Marinobacterium jannaschii]|uniref:hypothetical protein n=1 Tax=Marinobacterium jannaschii TaxID=64970 RepID=UPI0004891E5C|nr:hypothetical protein [Marinobacterium jannaschii]
MRVLLLVLLFLCSPLLQARIGPHSSFSEIDQSPLHRPLIPVVPFYVHSQDRSNYRLIWVRVNRLKFFYDRDGDLMLFAGFIRLCNRGADGCVWQTVPAVRPAAYRFKSCWSDPGGNCGQYQPDRLRYPVFYKVPVMERLSVSDSFLSGRLAFHKRITLPHCDFCRSLKLTLVKESRAD